MAEKKKSVMLIVIIIVIGLLAAGGAAYFIATKYLAKNDRSDKPQEAGVMMKIGDPKEGLVVNVGGVDSGHYLKIGLTLEVKPDENPPAGEGKTASPEEIKILDTVDFVLRSQNIENFAPDKQELLKKLIKDAVNKALGQDKVYNVYITNFVFQ
jgi:flagellar protein FliL